MSDVTIVPLPKQAIDEDQRLEKSASGSTEALMKHRWHWTLNEANPKRISIAQYAREVGRHQSLIYRYANAYVLVSTRKSSPDEALSRAAMTAERYEAVQAVAKARDITTGTVRVEYGDEVRRIRETARERAERKGTTVEKELQKAAEWSVRSEKAERRVKQEEKARHSWQYIKADGHLDTALDWMARGIEAMRDVEFDREERELLLHRAGALQEGAELVRAAAQGKSNAAWSKKLDVLKGGLSA